MLVVGVVLIANTDVSFARKKPGHGAAKKSSHSASSKHGSSVKGTKKMSKSARAAARKRDLARAVAEARIPKALAVISIAKDSILTDGIIYRQIHVTHSDSSHSLVHALTCVLRNPNYSVMTLKAENQSNALEKLKNFRLRLDSAENKTIYAAVNAHFWRAVSTTPIGPTVCNGEVCEMQPYKDWCCCFFDAKSRPMIDTVTLSGTIRKKRGQSIRISSVNRRLAPDSIVVFNSFVGQTVPPVATTQIEQELDESMYDSTMLQRDSTDIRLTRDSLRNALITLRQEASAEFNTSKIQLRYLRSPAVNQETPLVVLKSVDSGSVSMPHRGCVLSMSKSMARNLNLVEGDTVFMRFQTSRFDSTTFSNAVCGTPLLVTKGHIVENLKPTGGGSVKFYYKRLARTAIGTDITRNTVYLVTVESNARSRGFTIAELAEFMKRFGAYSAMNLDGGGSAQMLVGDSIVSHTPDQGTRRISVALALGKRKARPGTKKVDDARKED